MRVLFIENTGRAESISRIMRVRGKAGRGDGKFYAAASQQDGDKTVIQIQLSVAAKRRTVVHDRHLPRPMKLRGSSPARRHPRLISLQGHSKN